MQGSNSGGLFALGGSPQSAQSSLDVTAVRTPKGPMAFVIYLAPPNYATNLQDYSDMRTITLQVQSHSDPNYTLTASISAVRPPVVLVHGLWGQPGDWADANFTIPINLYIQTVDYYNPLLQATATYPSYPSWLLNLNAIPTSALGLSYNAGLVYNPQSVNVQIRKFIRDFRQANNAAAVTADVVAHSMGGLVVRTMALDPLFASNDTYGNGPINKLITIGTPHLGSPLATDLLQDANQCVRGVYTKAHKASLITATTSQGTFNGAVADLEGDGVPNGFLSPALTRLVDAGPYPFPVALISSTTNPDNLSNLNCGPYYCQAWWVKQACDNPPIVQDPLAIALMPTDSTGTTGWNTIFGQPNDAVVPISSQLDGRLGGGGPNTPTLTGVIHSQGLYDLDFSPPSELEPRGAPAQVLILLNEPLDGGDFHGARTGGH